MAKQTGSRRIPVPALNPTNWAKAIDMLAPIEVLCWDLRGLPTGDRINAKQTFSASQQWLAGPTTGQTGRRPVLSQSSLETTAGAVPSKQSVV